jgi:hypothetical protein
MSEADLICKTFQRQLMHFWDDRMPRHQRRAIKLESLYQNNRCPKRDQSSRIVLCYRNTSKNIPQKSSKVSSGNSTKKL